MTTITTINPSDLITDSRAVINDNFTNLNSDKIETSYLDTDTTLAANSDSKIATQKAVKAYVDAFVGAVSVSSTTGTSLSVTTTSSQTLIVFAKGDMQQSFVSGETSVNLKYNSVTKDTVNINMAAGNAQNGKVPFALMYTESPGEATHNITVTGTNTLANVVIIAIKLG